MSGPILDPSHLYSSPCWPSLSPTTSSLTMLASSHSPAPSLTTSTLSLTRQHLPLPLALAMPPQDLAAPLFPLRAPLTAPGGSEDRRRQGLRRGYSASGDVDLRRTWWRCPVSSLSLSLSWGCSHRRIQWDCNVRCGCGIPVLWDCSVRCGCGIPAVDLPGAAVVARQ